MKVRALKPGFYDGCRRRVGDVFEFAGSAKQVEKSKWLQPADAKAPITDDQRAGPPAGSAEAVKLAHKAKKSGKAGNEPKRSAAVAVLTDDKSTGDQEVI